MRRQNTFRGLSRHQLESTWLSWFCHEGSTSIKIYGLQIAGNVLFLKEITIFASHDDLTSSIFKYEFGKFKSKAAQYIRLFIAKPVLL